MPDRDELDGGVGEGLVEIERLLARDTEDILDALRLQAFHEHVRCLAFPHSDPLPRRSPARSLPRATSPKPAGSDLVMRALTATLAIAAAGSALVPVAASAADRYYVYGRGFGHGVGMSQYGSYGYAQHGWTYDQILRHYYQGTSLGATSPSLRVRVLLGTGRGAVHVSHVRSAGGRAVAPSRSYTVVAAPGNRVAVKNPSGRVIRRASPGVTLVGSA